MNREPCRYCRLPLATVEDVQNETDEHGLCWSIVDHCDVDAEDAIDAHLATIARLEREIQDWKDKLNGSEITHAATRADLRDCKRELEQERQDRKQADLDTIRALGERNDARKALEQERQLADRLAGELEQATNYIDFETEYWPDDSHLSAWKAARNEAVDPPNQKAP